jgi:hypothetical protein
MLMIPIALLISSAALTDPPKVDPSTIDTLKRMTEFVRTLKQFGVHTENTLEDQLGCEHRKTMLRLRSRASCAGKALVNRRFTATSGYGRYVMPRYGPGTSLTGVQAHPVV